MALGGFSAVAPGGSSDWAGVLLLKAPPRVWGRMPLLRSPICLDSIRPVV